MSMQKSSPRLALVAGLAAATCLALAPAVSAAKGGGPPNTSASSLALVMIKDKNGNGLPNWGDTVTFDVSTTAFKPSVLLECSQNGYEVSRQQAGFFPGYMFSKEYALRSSYWTGGAADCTATLFEAARNGRQTTLATLSFHVEA
jgi:hypothetical protein